MEKINNRCHKCFWFIIFLFIVLLFLLFCFNSNALMDNIFLRRNEYLKSDLQPHNQQLQEDSNLQPQNKQQPENSNLQPQNNQQLENSNLQPKNKQQAENSNLQPREQQQPVNSILQPQHQQQLEDSILQPHKRRQPLIKEEHKVRPTFSRTGWFATNQFALEVIFYYRMKQYECLTTNSSLASAIYVPFFAGLDVSRYLWGGFNTTVRDFHSLELVKWVANKPEWRAFGGRDHFLVGGRITCDFRRPRDTDSEWGNKLLALPQVKNMTVLEIESSPWSSYDIGVPYPTYFHPSKDREVSQWQRRMRGQKRRWLFSFAGAPRPGSLDSIRGEIINQCLASKRSKLLECSQRGNKCHSPSSIMKMFRRSVFCLHPQGDSYTLKASTIAAFARMTVEDSRKLLPAQFYPPWVVFSQRQKLNWLNLELTKIWPYVNEESSSLKDLPVVIMSSENAPSRINKLLIFFLSIEDGSGMEPSETE